jgi:quercetin dioxygenase-like cupin family protein
MNSFARTPGIGHLHGTPMRVAGPNEQSARRGPPEWFTGTVWIEDIAGAGGPAGVRVLRVSFQPGARTAWHTHPAGQTLHILSGLARVQTAGGAVVEVRPGDSVWFDPGERHWHGAAPGKPMVHLAVQAEPDGRSTEWYAHVTDEEYGPQGFQ